MNSFPEKLFDQIKQWKTKRDELDDKIDSIYELLDRDEMVHKEGLLQEIRILNAYRDELDDCIDSAYEQLDRYIYNQAM